MNKRNIPKFLVRPTAFVTKHSPAILVGLGVAGMLTSTVLAVRATPRALDLIEERKRELEKDTLTPVEVVKATWKCYLPSVVTSITSTGCLIAAHSVHTRRHAALATAYKLSETAFAEYRDKVVETVGENKEKSIREKLDADQIEKTYANNNNVIRTSHGSTLFLDNTSGRFFESDIDHVRKAENMLNKQMLHDMFGYASLNDFYDELDLPRTDIGDSLGWNVHRLIDIRLGSGISPEGRPCIVIEHVNRPEYGYDTNL